MNTQKQFPIEQVLSVTHRIVSTGHVSKIPELLSWVFGRIVFTHQWKEAAAEATPVIVEQHPFLADLSLAHINPANYKAEVQKIKDQYGEFLAITRPPGH